MGYSVWVDPEVCISSGNCIRRAPEAFDWGDDDTAEAQQGAGELSDETLVQVARGCPVGAVRLRGADGSDVNPFQPA